MREDELYKTQNIFFKPIVLKLGNNAKLKVGENNIFHPMVYIVSDGGDIIIGNFNVFEEKTFIYNKSKTSPMIVGDANYFKIGARIQSCGVGNLNEFGINSYADGCLIGNCNIIGADSKLKPNNQLMDKKTVSFNGNIADNLIYDEARRKKMISLMIKKTYELYKRLITQRMERTSQVPAQRS